MTDTFRLIKPDTLPPLDEGFRPAALANRAFRQEVDDSGEGVPLVIGLQRSGDSLSRFETVVFPEGHPTANANLFYVERLVKFLLWSRGGWKVFVGGPESIGQHIHQVYSSQGARSFDHHFMGQKVYQKPFTVVTCAAGQVPPANEGGQALGRNLQGDRIGFDLGASDVKVSAVVDGEAIFSTEIIWEPVEQDDPGYHYDRIKTALGLARSKLTRLDAIGGSSAGVYVDNRPRVASLFRGIPDERFDEVRDMFLRFRDEFGVPLEIVNDGDVTALAGSMSLEDNGVLGIAMGSSEAAGYVNLEGNITGWLNELAFAPVDYQPDAPVDEWSGDRGVGALYFSQQCVFRLAPRVGIVLPAGEGVTKAARLKVVQACLEKGHEGALQIWQTIGTYLGYSLAHYADFYELRHVLILGRVTSGQGGCLILEGARQVLESEFPELAARIDIQLPDEKSRRVGQSIAAASLPRLQEL
ncbi:MAG: ROK family protein [Chloroflexota bacterium]|nr:ROK family protein [Chloroflexota bacterium]